jgi:hypothetical protein
LRNRLIEAVENNIANCNYDTQFAIIPCAIYITDNSDFHYITSSILPLSGAVIPSHISEKQIRKRLLNLKPELITLDTKHPDCMGENLEKWLRVIDELKSVGNKTASVIIDENSDSPAELSVEQSAKILRIKCETAG